MKISTFEASRGLLALWVVLGHTVKHSGYDLRNLGVFSLLSEPGRAVDCFIMLSGFVIFYLLDHQRVSYGDFITRRFFRIAPIYFVVLAVAIFSIQWQTEVIRNYPWQSVAAAHALHINMDTIAHMTSHVIAHITMLHGLVPDKILPDSQYALIGQAWSISVEWQFYLIAPFLFNMIAKKEMRSLSFVLLAVCGLRAWSYGGEGFVVNQAAFFFIGIASYYLWKHVHSDPDKHAGLGSSGALILMVFFYLTVKDSVSLVIWAGMLGIAFAETCQRRDGVFGRLSQVLSSTPFQFLGRISYSIYMTHMLVLRAWQAILPGLVPSMDKPAYLAFNMLAVAISTIALSALCYRFIEAPGIRLGSKMVSYRRSIFNKPVAGHDAPAAVGELEGLRRIATEE